MKLLGQEDAKPMSTQSAMRTSTTGSLVELNDERRVVYRKAVGSMLYMCQERADIMFSVEETDRRIMNPLRATRWT